MRYPDDFDTKASEFGRSLAVARKMAISAMFIFVLIIFMCVLVVWANKSAKLHPFLISVNDVTGQWQLVGHQHKKMAEVETAHTLQESVVGKFVRGWFLLTPNEKRNRELWQKCASYENCDPSKKSFVGTEKCTIYCLTSDTLYSAFIKDVIPDYIERIKQGQSFYVDMSSLRMNPTCKDIKDVHGCTWQVQFNLKTNARQKISVLGYAMVYQDINRYPQTMGYYISDFYSYKID